MDRKAAIAGRLIAQHGRESAFRLAAGRLRRAVSRGRGDCALLWVGIVRLILMARDAGVAETAAPGDDIERLVGEVARGLRRVS